MQIYDVKITTLGPLHIGSGEKPGSKSRWLRDGRIWLVDEGALFQKIADAPHLLNRFEHFSLDKHQSLLGFLNAAHIDPKTVSLYKVRNLGGKPNRYYFSHIKTPGRPPKPYIPGSSLKGALRSALLRARLIEDEGMKERAAELVRQQMWGHHPNSKQADDALERAVFGPDQHHEWTRLFQVADTQPISTGDLWATDVRILSVRGPEGSYRLEEKTLGGGRPLTLYPEVIRTLADLRTRLVIQDELLSSQASGALRFPQRYGDVAQLLKACNRTAKEQLIQEWTFARDTRWELGQRYYGWMVEQLEKAMQNDACLLRLGWGAGYDDKTVTDLLDDDTFREVLDTYGLTVGRPGRRRNNPPMDKPFAPKSRNVALDSKGRWMPLGWVRMAVSPA